MEISSANRLAEKVQGKYLLNVSRIVYLVAAALCVIVTVGGIGFAIGFHWQGMAVPWQESVPSVERTEGTPIDVSVVESHLKGPSEVRVLPFQDLFVEPIDKATYFAYFTATTVNGLADYPNDVMILGGDGMRYFSRASYKFTDGVRSVLVPAEVLVEEFNRSIATVNETVERSFNLKIVIRDKFGQSSEPIDTALRIRFGPIRDAVQNTTRVVQPPVEPGLSPYQVVAREIAAHLDPNRTPAYLAAYNRALNLPRECGTNEQDGQFIAEVKRALASSKPALSPANIEAFYRGLCTAWKIARNTEVEANRASQSAHDEAIARNRAAEIKMDALTSTARTMRNTSIGVAAGAFLTFLLISISLAVLAIEHHLRAMRVGSQEVPGSLA